MRIEVTGLVKEYQRGSRVLPILAGLDLRVDSGASVAVVGPSGSGKTTLLGLMAGLDRPTRGEVRLGDIPLSALTEDARAEFRAVHVGFVFQTFHLLASLTALQNVEVPLELAPRSRRRPVGEVRRRAEVLLEQVGLGDRLHHYPAELSGGEQQRVALARAFVTEPRILFADEPTGNLDRETGATIVDLLRGLNEERGTTMVLVTHDEGIAGVADRVLRLADGELEEVR
ncbi:MAG: ABC transporter ATP-binding protein [Gammaproteobacteria bacterium]|nr:ABC transporter ATP-binding protein [Gammaproteobacteria bacterium]MDE0248771.1 ABC transporter ATP-binding protein [Gammaproteobacteria bacterium]